MNRNLITGLIVVALQLFADFAERIVELFAQNEKEDIND
jgi:hypothetical protein